MQVTLRVLIAEDDAALACSMADLLEAEGHKVAVAFDGASALQMATAFGQRFDVLVTDLDMPGLRGEDLIRALTALRPSLPVVVVTGSAPSGGVDALRDSSGGHHALTLLDKPVAGAVLIAAVRCASSLCRAPGFLARLGTSSPPVAQ